jgi:hypothetical protein
MKNTSKLLLFIFIFYGFSIGRSFAAEKMKYDILDITGITEKDARDFYEKMKFSILNNQREELSQMIHFPIGVTINGKRIKMENKNAFLVNYDQIINKHMVGVIKKTDFVDLKPNWRGLFVGNGEIIFGGIGSLKHYIVLITAINNQLK